MKSFSFPPDIREAWSILILTFSSFCLCNTNRQCWLTILDEREHTVQIPSWNCWSQARGEGRTENRHWQIWSENFYTMDIFQASQRYFIIKLLILPALCTNAKSVNGTPLLMLIFWNVISTYSTFFMSGDVSFIFHSCSVHILFKDTLLCLCSPTVGS